MVPHSALTRSLPDSRSHVEALLRARKLDRTLTSAMPTTEDRVMPCGLATLDTALRGGFRRGHVSEVAGPSSSGRTSLVWQWLGEATHRGEAIALVDTFDRFDPASGVACGIDLSRMLWVRGQALSKTSGAVDPAWLPGIRAVEGPGTMLERTLDRALKALNLVLQAGVCTAVALDLADVPAPTLRRIPSSTWLRMQRILEGSDIGCVVITTTPLARSAEGVTVRMDAAHSMAEAPLDPALTTQEVGPAGCPDVASSKGRHERARVAGAAVQWAGTHERGRRLASVNLSARVISARCAASSEVSLTACLDPRV